MGEVVKLIGFVVERHITHIESAWECREPRTGSLLITSHHPAWAWASLIIRRDIHLFLSTYATMAKLQVYHVRLEMPTMRRLHVDFSRLDNQSNVRGVKIHPVSNRVVFLYYR